MVRFVTRLGMERYLIKVTHSAIEEGLGCNWKKKTPLQRATQKVLASPLAKSQNFVGKILQGLSVSLSVYRFPILFHHNW